MKPINDNTARQTDRITILAASAGFIAVPGKGDYLQALYDKHQAPQAHAWNDRYPLGTIRTAITDASTWIGPIDCIWEEQLPTSRGTGTIPSLCIRAQTSFKAPAGITEDVPMYDYITISKGSHKRLELRTDAQAM